MAKIIDGIIFQQELEAAIIYAHNEFGTTTAKRWYKEYTNIRKRLEKFPTSYSPVVELSSYHPDVRGAIIMRNFKILYWYDPKTDTVFLTDLWDMRKHPNKLKMKWRNLKL